MKSYLTRTRRGERKRGRREHQHHTPGPERANPERAREKEKRRVDGHGTRPAEGGGGRKRLNQPDTANTYKHLSTRRSQPTWGGKNAWDRGPMGISWWNHKKLKQDSVPKPKGRAIIPCTGTVVKSCSNWHITASKVQRIRCTTCFTSPDNHQKEKDHTWKTWACLIQFHVVLPNVAVKLWNCCKNGGFWMFSTASQSQSCIPRGITRDRRISGTLKKRCKTERAAVTLYLNELLD